MKNSIFAALFFLTVTLGLRAAAPVPEPPPKPTEGFSQEMSYACFVETNVSPAFTKKVVTMVRNAEEKFYKLFKLTPDLMHGWAKEKFDYKSNIPGTFINDLKIKPWIDIKVYKDQEMFADEWFELTHVNDPMQRMTQGLPGAYFSMGPDYTSKGWALRKIRSFVSNRDDEELERTLLHEMGHLFVTSFMLAFAGNSRAQVSEDKRDIPSWINEGVAQLFELLFTNSPSSKKALIKQQAMIYEAIKLKDTYPFNEFINVANAHNLKAVAGDPLKATINYAQSASVMDYMVNKDGARFFAFLSNLREQHIKRNFQTSVANQNKNLPTDMFSFQEEAFQQAFNVPVTEVEKYWKEHVTKTMEASLKKQPELHYWIGEYYLRRGKDKAGDLKRAEEEFATAMKLAPDKGEGYLGTGRMLLRKRDYEAALPLLEKAAKLMPKDEDAWYYLGFAQVNSGRVKEAVVSFENALKIYPRNANALGGLALAAKESKQYDKAFKAYDDAYTASRRPYYLFEKGQAAFFAKKYDIAQAGFAAYEKAFPMDGEAKFWYGMAASRLGNKDFAVKKMEEALALFPNNGFYRKGLELTKAGKPLRLVGEEDEQVAVNKNGDKVPATPNATPKSKPKELLQFEDE